MPYNPEYHRQYYLANKERKLEQSNRWAAANPDKIRAKSRRQYAKPGARERSLLQTIAYEIRNPERVLLAAAKTRAKKAGLEFDIEAADIVFPETCPVLGIPLEKCKNGPNNNSPSVDRIDPSKGYVRGNVWVISWQANRMKCNATPDDLVKFAKAMLKLFG